MRRISTKLIPVVIAFSVAMLANSNANANKLDITLGRFVECTTPDATTGNNNCRAQNGAFESFMAEYAFGVSPKLMAPASTLGYSGFYLGIESSIVVVPDSGTDDFAGENFQESRWRIGTGEFNGEPPAMLFPTVHIRKGLPWSLELGSSISYLAQSETVALGGEVKWAPFEGYKTKVRGALPDIAARGTVNRIIGQSDVDLTVMGVDGSISYQFGVGGMISLEPYAGYQHLWTFVRTEPIVYRDDHLGSSAPTFHASTGSSYDMADTNFTGPNLSRHKIFFGLNVKYELLSITMDWAWGLPKEWQTTQNAWNDDGTNNGEEEVTASVDTQFAFSFGTALQF